MQEAPRVTSAIATADSDHRARIAGLIKDKFADHQVIIATHDVHFYEALRRELRTGGYPMFKNVL